MVMDRITEEDRRKSQWTMMPTDNIAICGEISEQVEESQETWRYTLEKRGMKVRNKTEYMCVNEMEAGRKVNMQEIETEKVDEVSHPKQWTVHTSREEESSGRMEWIETNIRGYL